MKKTLLGCSILAITFGACTKKESTKLPPPVIDTVYVDTHNHSMPIDTSVVIAGISDLLGINWDEVSLDLSVMRTKGLEQKVSMMVSGLPENAKAKWSAASGYTTFNTSLMLDLMFVKSGTYPLTIASTTESGKTKDYTVNLVVDSMTKRECNNALLSNASGSLSTTDPAIDSVVYTFTTLQNDFSNTQISLRNVVLSFDMMPTKNFLSYSATSNYHVKVNINCEDGTFTIPEQEVMGRSMSGGNTEMFTISGTGMIDLKDNSYWITYSTEHDDAGSNVVKTYKVHGNMVN
jgi:hypothetical protein